MAAVRAPAEEPATRRTGTPCSMRAAAAPASQAPLAPPPESTSATGASTGPRGGPQAEAVDIEARTMARSALSTRKAAGTPAILRARRHRQRRQLGVAGAARRQLAAHEREVIDALASVDTPAQGLGQARLRPGRAHAPQRDVGRESAALRLEAEPPQGGVDAGGERRRRLRPLLDSGPEHARARPRGERAELAHAELERRVDLRDLSQGGGDGLQPPGLDATEELERQMEVVAPDPGDVARQRSQTVHFRRQTRAQPVGQEDRDEGANGLYRGASSFRMRASRPRSRGVGALAHAAPRAATHPSPTVIDVLRIMIGSPRATCGAYRVPSGTTATSRTRGCPRSGSGAPPRCRARP